MLDAVGNVLARESFTAFGARRGSNWQGVPSTADYTTFSSTTRQGFTGQEMLDSVGLVHMNGRVYDPTLGRFLSADTVIQTLGSSQAINPYAYAWNDPLKYIDPSGHSLLGDIVGAIVGAVLAYFTFGAAYAFLASEYVVGAGVYAGALAGFVGGFVGAYISTGSLSAALTAGLVAGVVGGLTAGIGQKVSSGNWTPAEGVIARVGVGCASAAASGGNCGKGALSAGFAIAAQPLIIKFPSFGQWSKAAESVEAGLIGGEAARLAGGKFEDGFSTAAVQYLVGPQSQQAGRTDQSVGEQLWRDAKAIVVDIYAVAVGQLGALYVFVRYDLPGVATDFANGGFLKAFTDFGATIFHLALPHYGYYGGAGWGVSDRYTPWGTPLNQVDDASFQHDLSCPPCASGAWASNTFTNNSSYLPTGPFGMIYQLLGLVPFSVAGAMGH